MLPASAPTRAALGLPNGIATDSPAVVSVSAVNAVSRYRERLVERLHDGRFRRRGLLERVLLVRRRFAFGGGTKDVVGPGDVREHLAERADGVHGAEGVVGLRHLLRGFADVGARPLASWREWHR